ncbi:MAG: anhydro-N-acetylmuramic acid kinase [Gammaproteobacteria bacterium]|tara:strand:- start:409 stop:1440 length:1032 start_codon:yes stop_codon:yes gene_type:complete
MNKYYIGIMTGTSADAIDGCIVSFDGNFNLITSGSVDHEHGYKENYEECIAQGVKEVHRSKKLEKLEHDLNKKSLELIENLLNESKLSNEDEIAIGFSGQTVFHSKKKSYQIGDSQFIANNSNIKVISDFRNFDIAQGGSGAPLVPAFHKYLYSEKEKEKIIFNIGGIANGTYLKGSEISLASDVGPGNCLIDKITSKELGLPFDSGGELARKGMLLPNLLDSLEKAIDNINFGYPRADEKTSYYKLLDSGVLLGISPNDALRCLTELTAEKIKNFFDYCNQPKEVIFHGGGTNNSFLMDLLGEKLEREIRTTDNIIPSKFVEAAAFAYLAFMNRGKVFNTKL